MRRDNSGIDNTCPKIDEIINAIKSVDWSDSSHYDEKSLVDILEQIRTANSSLREWGNQMNSERDEFENDLDCANDKISDLDREISDKNDEIKELDARISELEKLIDGN